MPTAQPGKTTRSTRKPPHATAPTAGKATSAPARNSVAPRNAGPVVGSPQWQEMVATAAYFRAEARGFRGGSAEQDWLEAEAEIVRRFSGNGSKPAKSGKRSGR